ncbi:MAG: hypothetical protein ACFFE3_11420 [Candidatus Thorarchaeota archaeon]
MLLKRSGIIIIVLMLIIEALIIPSNWIDPLSWGVVPFTGMRAAVTYIIFWLVWPIVGGMVLAVIMPRILGPIFIRLKGAIWRDYENAYVDIQPPLTQKRILRRALYLGLLTMGIVSLLVYILPPELFIPPGDVSPPISIFHLASVSTIAGLVVPIAIAMWSVSWSFHDASLVHYKMPDIGKEELYEIEPVYLRYDTLLKGYAGLSSILFIVNLLLYQFVDQQALMVIVVLYVFMHMTLLTLPSLYVHSRMNHLWLRKNLPKARRLTKSDIRILEE